MARVLVVDDEEDIRSLIRFSLELDGHDVVEAADGFEALRAMGPATPDLLVLDLTMPRLDGWEVLLRLKASGDRAQSDVPVILLTALDGDVDRIRGGIEGAVRYLTKPFDPEQLRSEVRRAIDEPEPELRKQAARRALEQLAMLERGGPPAGGQPAAHPHVTRLGGPIVTTPARPRPRRFNDEQLASLSDRQRQLLDAVGRCPSVLAAAEELRVSRSNVYASLRRIARRLQVATVTELVAMARQESGRSKRGNDGGG